MTFLYHQLKQKKNVRWYTIHTILFSEEQEVISIFNNFISSRKWKKKKRVNVFIPIQLQLVFGDQNIYKLSILIFFLLPFSNQCENRNVKWLAISDRSCVLHLCNEGKAYFTCVLTRTGQNKRSFGTSFCSMSNLLQKTVFFFSLDSLHEKIFFFCT